jgi:hypothetical protein
MNDDILNAIIITSKLEADITKLEAFTRGTLAEKSPMHTRPREGRIGEDGSGMVGDGVAADAGVEDEVWEEAKETQVDVKLSFPPPKLRIRTTAPEAD